MKDTNFTEVKKKVSIVIPTFNEIQNVEPFVEAVQKELTENLSEYDYEIIIIDNHSTDGTEDKIEELCKRNKKIKAIFNLKNYGPDNSPYYGMMQSTGDCAIMICCDFQDPIEMIHKMVRIWEKGSPVVIGLKDEKAEGFFLHQLRNLYYRIISKFSEVDLIRQFTGFGCFDKSLIEIMRNLDDPVPFFRGVVAEFSSDNDRAYIHYPHLKRKAGHSHIRFDVLYDIAMRSFTSYTKVGLRLASFLGYIVAFLSLLVSFYYLIMKLTHWDDFEVGVPAVIVGLFFISAVQLIFLGFLGEYILSINHRIMKRPIVTEKKRINF
ncbi:MAG: glycosyltransferase family 2 protein [Succinatimonas hippei]|nr:glycosyltransferase family 2 protein [Succinatimonas hippei]